MRLESSIVGGQGMRSQLVLSKFVSCHCDAWEGPATSGLLKSSATLPSSNPSRGRISGVGLFFLSSCLSSPSRRRESPSVGRVCSGSNSNRAVSMNCRGLRLSDDCLCFLILSFDDNQQVSWSGCSQ